MRHLRVLALAIVALSMMSACEQPKSSEKPDEPSVVESPNEPEAVVVGEEEPDEKPSVEEGKIANPLLWVHRSDKGDVYLFGTIHVAVDAHRELPKMVWNALEGSKTFVMETNLDEAAGDVMSRATLPAGRTLEDELGKEDYKKLGEVMGPSLGSYKSFKPWFIVSLLIQKMLPEGEDPAARMDPALASRASTRGLEVGYLEKASFQLDVLEQVMTADELAEMARDWNKQRSTLKKMLAVYRSGDTAELEKITFEDKARKPMMFKKLFYERNDNWEPQIIEYIGAEGGVFIAVGVGHIIGEGGLLDLLGKKGYTFERVTLETTP